jgi:rfaE bifunctional protein kinase chain/domain
MIDELHERYRGKVKTVEELLIEIGGFPRDQKLIMCHGVFDVVHPGHLRHLIYAKGKADLLVASLTADRHISKGAYRPHVPQDLRALALAAFDIVDYVIIDKNPTPIDNLRTLRPDFFAKGYEYVADGIKPKTSEEEQIVSEYGGKIIFTPGDIVYSSSNLIELAPPEIQTEKLLTVMRSRGVEFEDLHATLDAMEGKKVHVVGDTIVDSFTQCTMIGGQTKTPTMSVLFEEKKDYIGGAGVVAMHLAAAGADVTFSTVLGDDDFKDFVRDGLAEAGIACTPIIDASRPTTNKNAIVAANYRLLKVDTLDNSSVSDEIVGELINAIEGVETDAVIFSDFRHGMFNRRTIPTLIEAIPNDVLRVADSQVASRWGNITEFKGFDLVTPNEREARFALADQDLGVRPLASALYDAAECKLLVLKLGPRGVLTCRDTDHESLDSFYVVDSFADNVLDAVGAGDALLAYATLALLVQENDLVATILGSMAAAVECERDGNIPVRPSDVRAKIELVERHVRFGEEG